MDWNALQEMECPKCQCLLLKNEVGYGCCSCTFKIRETKFNDIINGLNGKRKVAERDEVEDNLEDLNNL